MVRSAVCVSFALATLAVSAPVRAEVPCACDATPAACDAGCACDFECDYDWSADECADPLAGCREEVEPTAELLEELEGAPDPEPEPWGEITDPWSHRGGTGDLECAEDAAASGGRCVDLPPEDLGPAVPDGDDHAVSAGSCAVGGSGAGPLALAAMILLLVIMAAARLLGLPRLLALAVLPLSCADQGDPPAATLDAWDRALVDGADEEALGDFIDVHVALLRDGDGAVHVPAFHADVTVAGHHEPAPAFAVSRYRLDDMVEVRRVAAAPGCGDRLLSGRAEGELVGYAAREAGPGRALLVELVAQDGCGARYETDPDAIASLRAAGYEVSAALGHVWPPGWGAVPELADEFAVSEPCAVSRRSPAVLFLGDPGPEVARIAAACPGEIVVGARDENAAPAPYQDPAWQAAGITTAFVVGHGGAKLAALFDAKGVEGTAAYLRAKLETGAADPSKYDFIAFEGLSAASYRDGTRENLRLRLLLRRLPRRSVIARLDGEVDPADRPRLLRALERRARVIALSVPNAAEVAALRAAARRLDDAVRPLGVRQLGHRVVTVIGPAPGASESTWTPAELAAVRLAAVALLRGGGLLPQQRGIGFAASFAALPEDAAGELALSAACWNPGQACAVEGRDRAAKAARQRAPRYGVHLARMPVIRDPADPATSDARVMADNHIRYVRVNVLFHDGWMAPELDPALLAEMDAGVLEAAAHGVHVFPTLLKSNVALVSAEYGAWRRFAAVLAGRYGPTGTLWASHPEVVARPIRAWEIWNEPNLAEFWPHPSPDGFREALRHAKRGLRSVDPNARIIFGGLSPIKLDYPDGHDAFLKRVAREKGGDCLFDAVGIHPYGSRVDGAIDVIRRTYDALRSDDLELTGVDPRRDVPIWLTENGWALADESWPYCKEPVDWQPGQPCSELEDLTVRDEETRIRRMREFARAVDGRRAKWRLGPTFWFNFEDLPAPENPCGPGQTPEEDGCNKNHWWRHAGFFALDGTARAGWGAIGQIAGNKRSKLPPVRRCDWEGACGDGTCAGDETDASCPADCGCAAGCQEVAAFGCFCDAACAEKGDCCADAVICR